MNYQMTFSNITTIHSASHLRRRYSPMQEPQSMTQYEFILLRMITGTPLLCLLYPKNGNFVVQLWIPPKIERNSTSSTNEDLLYPMPVPKTLTSSINLLRTWKKWSDMYSDERRVLLILKEKLLRSGIGTLLQRYDIS
jgi:hypothetical protein